MSMTLHQQDGVRSGWRRKQPIADINVTPFIDVMLVLLIIFMVTAPLLVSGVPVDLPDAKAKSLPQDNVPIQVSITANGNIYLDRAVVSHADFPAKLAALRTARSDDAHIYVRADAAIPYGAVMATVGDISSAGFKKVALVTETEAKRK
jgi:biopolymer transport protein TolR